jgi:hypothetical protein
MKTIILKPERAKVNIRYINSVLGQNNQKSLIEGTVTTKVLLSQNQREKEQDCKNLVWTSHNFPLSIETCLFECSISSNFYNISKIVLAVPIAENHQKAVKILQIAAPTLSKPPKDIFTVSIDFRFGFFATFFLFINPTFHSFINMCDSSISKEVLPSRSTYSLLLPLFKMRMSSPHQTPVNLQKMLSELPLRKRL